MYRNGSTNATLAMPEQSVNPPEPGPTESQMEAAQIAAEDARDEERDAATDAKLNAQIRQQELAKSPLQANFRDITKFIIAAESTLRKRINAEVLADPKLADVVRHLGLKHARNGGIVFTCANHSVDVGDNTLVKMRYTNEVRQSIHLSAAVAGAGGDHRENTLVDIRDPMVVENVDRCIDKLVAAVRRDIRFAQLTLHEEQGDRAGVDERPDRFAAA